MGHCQDTAVHTADLSAKEENLTQSVLILLLDKENTGLWVSRSDVLPAGKSVREVADWSIGGPEANSRVDWQNSAPTLDFVLL